MLYCPNYSCQTPNAEANKFCQKCRTPLPRRYLWTPSQGIEDAKAGDLFGNRYLYKGDHILLDTKPGLYPGLSMEELPESLLPYLRLSPEQLHIPQVYDWVRIESEDRPEKLVLLEQAAIAAPVGLEPAEPQLLPTLLSQWPQASPQRQLGWLWQLAQLWEPMRREHVSSTLLMPELIRTAGAIARLQELHLDPPGVDISLADLGHQWQQWLPQAHPKAAAVLEKLSQQLISGKINSATALVESLDHALAALHQGTSRRIRWATCTDQGPSRQRNEDACYPASGTADEQLLDAHTDTVLPMVVVCDGIGGHQGGNVASNLAIAAVQQQLQSLPLNRLTPAERMEEMESAIFSANDQISQRNDDEQRQDRQRMGTTLVMALVRAHEVYVAHVGDSRAYWMTRWGCPQITQDDDVASREVRLGYSFYREALQHPNSGSLVQALGMSTSSLLHPTVQRFLVDEDSVFLLCSDGLSDNDRVEQYWDTEILPVLESDASLATVTQRLVEIANTQNGHDNVTVALLHCQVPSSAAIAPSAPAAEAYPLAPEPPMIQPGPIEMGSAHSAASPVVSTLPTRVVAPPDRVQPAAGADRARSPRLWPGLLLLLAGGLLAWALAGPLRAWLTAQLGILPPVTPPSTPAAPVPLLLGSFVALPTPATLELLLTPPSAPATTPSLTPTLSNQIPAGSVLQVVEAQQIGSDRWLRLQVCSVGAALPPPTSPSPSPAIAPTAPQDGWIQATTLQQSAQVIDAPSSQQRGVCLPPSSPATPTFSPMPATPALSPPSFSPASPALPLAPSPAPSPLPAAPGLPPVGQAPSPPAAP